MAMENPPFEITCSYKNLKNQQFPTSLLCLLNLSEMTPFKGSDRSSRWICFWRRFSIPSYDLQSTIKLFSLYIHGPSLFYTRLTSMMLEGLQKLWFWRRLSEKTNVPQISALNICKQNIHQHKLVLISTVDFTSKSLSLKFLESWDPSPAFFFQKKGSWDLYWTNDMVHLHGSPPRALERCAAPRSADLPRILLCWQPSIIVLNVAHCNANHKTWAIETNMRSTNMKCNSFRSYWNADITYGAKGVWTVV